jgi:hypothetical protein
MRRYPCSLEVDCISCDGELSKVSCYNLSSLGAGIINTQSLVAGTKVFLKFSSKNNVDIPVEGKVRWCEFEGEKWKLGIEFNKLLFVPLDVII